MDQPIPQKPVAIYTTPTCHFCQMTREFFNEHGIEYTTYDVAKDLERRQEMFTITNQMGVPVVAIGEDIVIGFDKEKLSELLGISE